MTLSIILGHYDAICHDYDYLFEEINSACMEIIAKDLQLQPTDTVLDLGGGTGFIAEQICKTGELSAPVWCVDPSAPMIEKAKQRGGVVTVVAAGEDFFSDELSINFDKVLMNGVVHHFKDPIKIYRGVYEALKPDGFCLILNRLPATILPFFKAAKETFRKSCLEHKDLVKQLKTAGFQSVLHYEDALEIRVSKRKWYEMLRGRFYSPLDPFSDQEIQEGIEELENGPFGDLDSDASITMYDRLFVVEVKKENIPTA